MNRTISEIFALVGRNEHGDEYVVEIPHPAKPGVNIVMVTTDPERVPLLMEACQRHANHTGRTSKVKALTFIGSLTQCEPRPPHPSL